METLAIEFNRGIAQIKLALGVLIELEMIELTEDNIYRVKNFAKHQNIKVKEKIKSNDKEEDIKNTEVQVKENFENEIHHNKDEESENKISQKEEENISEDEIGNLEITDKDINKINEEINNNSQESSPILLETKKNKQTNKKKKKDNIEEENEDDRMVWFSDSDEGRSLAEDECVVWSF